MGRPCDHFNCYRTQTLPFPDISIAPHALHLCHKRMHVSLTTLTYHHHHHDLSATPSTTMPSIVPDDKALQLHISHIISMQSHKESHPFKYTSRYWFRGKLKNSEVPSLTQILLTSYFHLFFTYLVFLVFAFFIYLEDAQTFWIEPLCTFSVFLVLCFRETLFGSRVHTLAGMELYFLTPSSTCCCNASKMKQEVTCIITSS